MREAAREAGDAVSDAPEDGSYPEDDEHDIMDKQVVIVDLEGLGMSALRCLYVFKVINSVASYNYPELSKAIYVLNSPSVFDYLWSAVKPLLAAHTQSKIRIFQSGPEQYKALQQLFEERHPRLPHSAGGGRADQGARRERDERRGAGFPPGGRQGDGRVDRGAVGGGGQEVPVPERLKVRARLYALF